MDENSKPNNRHEDCSFNKVFNDRPESDLPEKRPKLETRCLEDDSFGAIIPDKLSEVKNEEIAKWSVNSSHIDSIINDDLNDEKDVEILSLDEDKNAREKLIGSKTLEERKVKQSKTTTYKMVLLFVTIGALLMICYTFFAQPLAFNARQMNASDNGVWNIKFVDMQIKSQNGNAKELSSHNFSDLRATFHVSLFQPGDEIVYDLTIANTGTIDAKVSSIIITPETLPSDSILYTVSDIYVGDELDAGKRTHMTVKIKYNENVDPVSVLNKKLEVIINYVQK